MPNLQPDLSFRSPLTPASILGSVAYAFSTLGSNFLPVLNGKNSMTNTFRIYNNYAKNAGIANAMNVNITTFDGIGVHTASTTPISQSWIRVQQTGYGENSTPPGLYTAFAGSDTAVGGTSNLYLAQVGSDGNYDMALRAGSGNAGVGFMEFSTYAQIPLSASMATWNFALDMLYEWSP